MQLLLLSSTYGLAALAVGARVVKQQHCLLPALVAVARYVRIKVRLSGEELFRNDNYRWSPDFENIEDSRI